MSKEDELEGQQNFIKRHDENLYEVELIPLNNMRKTKRFLIRALTPRRALYDVATKFIEEFKLIQLKPDRNKESQTKDCLLIGSFNFNDIPSEIRIRKPKMFEDE
jgi:hypothetical protein